MTYKVAEKFRSIQGEGVYAGTPMAFIRFVGCSVGKRICQHCDTDFEEMMPWRGGGEFSDKQLCEWAYPYTHLCFTGGEPLDQDLSGFIQQAESYPNWKPTYHVETSGTVKRNDVRSWAAINGDLRRTWICVSPKPGFLEDVVLAADEVKVIVPGLGTEKSLEQMKPMAGFAFESPKNHVLADRENFRWPTLTDALRWADAGKTVFLQPRNGKFDIDQNNLRLVQDILVDHPNLRLSVQMHKILKVQ